MHEALQAPGKSEGQGGAPIGHDLDAALRSLEAAFRRRQGAPLLQDRGWRRDILGTCMMNRSARQACGNDDHFYVRMAMGCNIMVSRESVCWLALGCKIWMIEQPRGCHGSSILACQNLQSPDAGVDPADPDVRMGAVRK